MNLSKAQILAHFEVWLDAWNRHDLEGVMQWLDDTVRFQAWTGSSVRGKASLRRAWTPWFANHGDFKFVTEDLFVDEGEQKLLFQWALDWPAGSMESHAARELRRGVDVIHLRDGKIVEKLTYTKLSAQHVEVGP